MPPSLLVDSRNYTVVCIDAVSARAYNIAKNNNSPGDIGSIAVNEMKGTADHNIAKKD